MSALEYVRDDVMHGAAAHTDKESFRTCVNDHQYSGFQIYPAADEHQSICSISSPMNRTSFSFSFNP